VLARRRRLLTIAVPLVVVFLAISFVTARFLTTENRERDELFGLVQREAAGDAPGARRERHPGRPVRSRPAPGQSADRTLR